MNNNRERNQSIETDPKMAQMIELVVKTATAESPSYSQMKR